ncbi:MAG TPA: hypothetical protein VLB84_20025 [Bacteroidia bacterium]|nr:hypothetical protein [Bacteroidia bacterium]
MDIVKFWKQQVEKWQEDEKCGFCWEFSAPLFENVTNIQQTEEDCCTYVFLTKLVRNRVPQFSANTGFLNRKFCDYSFTLHVVRKGDLGTNNYNEIAGHPIEESRWNEIYKPIADCLDCDLMLDFCEFVGLKVDEMTWREEMEQAYMDNNYFGWRITATFRVES